MNLTMARDLLLPGVADVDEKFPGIEFDIEKGYYCLWLLGVNRKTGQQEREILATQQELEDNSIKELFGPRVIAMARKLGVELRR